MRRGTVCGPSRIGQMRRGHRALGRKGKTERLVSVIEREVVHRPLYRGEIVWNKTKKRNGWGQVRQQDRPDDQWLRLSAPDLRIVPDPSVRPLMSGSKRTRRSICEPPVGGCGVVRPEQRRASVSSWGWPRVASVAAEMSVRSRHHRHRRSYYYVCTSYHTRGQQSARTATICRWSRRMASCWDTKRPRLN